MSKVLGFIPGERLYFLVVLHLSSPSTISLLPYADPLVSCFFPLPVSSGRETFFIGRDGIIKGVCTKQLNHKAHLALIESCLRVETEVMENM